jgi:hypothetical protein
LYGGIRVAKSGRAGRRDRSAEQEQGRAAAFMMLVNWAPRNCARRRVITAPHFTHFVALGELPSSAHA